jgi:hypothetical protein
MDICRIGPKEAFLAALAAATRAEQTALLAAIARDRPVPVAAALVLAAGLPVVCIAALPRGAYLWVAASLFFSLLYPALLLLPVLLRRRRGGDHAYLRTLRALGLLEPGRKLGYLAANAFVIGTRSVAPAFGWFATVNLAVALSWIQAGPASRPLGFLIAAQSGLAVGSGIVIWRMTPGVGALRRRAGTVTEFLSAHRAVGWTVVLVLPVLLALAAVLLFPVLIPAGPSFVRVLAEGRINPAARALELAALLAGLYLVTRMVQSRESRRMARQVAEAVVRYLDADLAPRLARGGPVAMDCEAYRALATGLLEARVYRFDSLTLAGRLPVYVLTPDLSLVADAETLAALRGHLELGPVA